jgi:hypothetical protein
MHFEPADFPSFTITMVENEGVFIREIPAIAKLQMAESVDIVALPDMTTSRAIALFDLIN